MLPGLGEDLAGVAHVAVQDRDRGAVDEQGTGVCQHLGVVVDVDDLRLWRAFVCDLMDIALGGQAGADVEELPDADVDQELDGPSEEGAVLLRSYRDMGDDLQDLLRRRSIGRKIVLSTQKVVIHPGDIRDIRIKFPSLGHRY